MIFLLYNWSKAIRLICALLPEDSLEVNHNSLVFFTMAYVITFFILLLQEHPEWEIKNGFVFFQKAKESAPSKEIPSLQLINQTLSYARELERIV